MILAFLFALLWAGAAQAASLPLTVTFQAAGTGAPPDAEWTLISSSVSGTTVADASSHGNTAAVVNGPLTFGALGATFNGNQYLDSALTVTSPALTVSAWINPSNLSNANPRIVANSHTDVDNRGFQLEINKGGGSGFFDVGNGTSRVGAPWTKQLAIGTTYHYVGVYNGSTVKAYINGVQVASQAFAGGAIAAGTGPHINVARSPAGIDPFIGAIADVRVYKRALSAAQVTALFQAGPPAPPPPAALSVTFNPLSPTVPCSAAPGTFVSAIVPSGGSGGAITYVPSGNLTDFKLSSDIPPANVIVGPNGIAAASCNTTQNVTVEALQ